MPVRRSPLARPFAWLIFSFVRVPALLGYMWRGAARALPPCAPRGQPSTLPPQRACPAPACQLAPTCATSLLAADCRRDCSSPGITGPVGCRHLLVIERASDAGASNCTGLCFSCALRGATATPSASSSGSPSGGGDRGFATMCMPCGGYPLRDPLARCQGLATTTTTFPTSLPSPALILCLLALRGASLSIFSSHVGRKR